MTEPRVNTTTSPTSAILSPANTASASSLAIGTRLADFEITGVLGEGGFGIVYVAFDHSLQRTVAIKEYMPGALAGRAADMSVMVRAERDKATFDIGRNSFINEARFLAQFDHPSLVKVYRYWEQNQTAYMAMRYYDGRTLKEIVANSPELVTEAWVKSIFTQILEALETLYDVKILHRDVSPDNIIVQKNGDAVLLDFGSARQIIGDMNKGLTVILKPGYAPVEQYAGDLSLEQGPWTDIYSLSAVMYFAIMQQAPPTSIARMVKDPVKPLSERGLPGFSMRFLAAIDKGLAVQAAERPQTINEFRSLLGIGPLDSARKRPSIQSARMDSRPAPAAQADDATVIAPARPKKVPLATAAPVAATPGKTRPESRSKSDSGAARKSRSARPPESAHKWPLTIGLLAGALLLAGISIYAFDPSPTHKSAPANASAQPAPAPPPAPTSAPTMAPSSAPSLPMAAAVGVATVDPEARAWDALKNDPNASEVQLNAFIAQYPTGKNVDAAKLLLAALHGKASASAPLASAASANATVAAAASADTPAAAPEAAPLATSYRLSIKPWGSVIVDGKDRGVSPPMKRLLLLEGKHKIRIVNPSFPPYSVDIDTTGKKFGTIEHDFSAAPK